MNADFSPEEVALATNIGEVRYGQAGSDQPLTLAQIYEALPGVPPAQIDVMLQRLDGCRLLRLAIGGGSVHATIKGKEAYEINAIAELAFGEAYIAYRYRSAVVHIVVHNPADGQESGGTGFFTNQPANRIVTAKHVIQGRTIVRIEDASGVVIPNVCVIQLGAGTPGFAFIQCPLPGGVYPLRVEWREEATRELDRVLILGYPPIAAHHVALLHASGQINAKLLQLCEKKKTSLT